MRTRIAFLALLALAPSFLHAATGADPRLAASRQILTDYSQVLEAAPPDARYSVANQEFLQHLQAGDVAIQISDAPCASLLNALSFDIDWKTGKSALTMNRMALSMYAGNKTVIYSLLCYEEWHYHSYLSRPDQFKAYRSDPFEQAMFESDSYQVEASFIKDILVPLHFATTAYEDYLANSLGAGSLGAFTSLFAGVDTTVVTALYTLRAARLSGKIDQNALYKQATSIGQAIVSGLPAAGRPRDEAQVMYSYITCATYQRFTQLLIAQTETAGKTYREIFRDQPDLEEVFKKVGAVVSTDGSPANAYRARLLTAFDIPAK